jgi:hypothetical protein
MASGKVCECGLDFNRDIAKAGSIGRGYPTPEMQMPQAGWRSAEPRCPPAVSILAVFEKNGPAWELEGAQKGIAIGHRRDGP